MNNVDLEKPAIGLSVVFFYNGNTYPAVVSAHCGMDFFYINFIGRTPLDDYPKDFRPAGTTGWHISLRGYKESWDYI